ncbi:MAG: Uma2 family endonuclease [Taibaiella sp.]|nr:Uma2 family endonuclease [Taibaiella sp.]
MAYPAYNYVSPGEYLSIESKSEEKHEYFEGRIYAMTGASLNNNFIVSNLSRKIGMFLDGKSCNLFGSDLRITTPISDAYMYPDVSIICGQVETQENSFDTATNPSVIIEVMSPSTKGFDMAFKFHYYKHILSLKEYILVDSTSCFIQTFKRKDATTWEDGIQISDERLPLSIDTIGIQLQIKDIYQNVFFTTLP